MDLFTGNITGNVTGNYR